MRGAGDAREERLGLGVRRPGRRGVERVRAGGHRGQGAVQEGGVALDEGARARARRVVRRELGEELARRGGRRAVAPRVGFDLGAEARGDPLEGAAVHGGGLGLWLLPHRRRERRQNERLGRALGRAGRAGRNGVVEAAVALAGAEVEAAVALLVERARVGARLGAEAREEGGDAASDTAEDARVAVRAESGCEASEARDVRGAVAERGDVALEGIVDGRERLLAARRLHHLERVLQDALLGRAGKTLQAL